MRVRYGYVLFTRYGFLDAFNPTLASGRMELRCGRIIPAREDADERPDQEAHSQRKTALRFR